MFEYNGKYKTKNIGNNLTINNNNRATGDGKIIIESMHDNFINTMTGVFSNGHLIGEGIMIKSLNGNQEIQDGIFENGILNGKGKQTIKSSDGSQEIYDGIFKNGKLNGRAKGTNIFGYFTDTFEGYFIDGEPTGEGKMSTSSGHISVGYLKMAN